MFFLKQYVACLANITCERELTHFLRENVDYITCNTSVSINYNVFTLLMTTFLNEARRHMCNHRPQLLMGGGLTLVVSITE